MIYHLAKREDRDKAVERFNYVMDKEIEIELKMLSNSRTSKQNRSLHKFFSLVSEQLNDLGLEFVYDGLKGLELSTRYTPDIVKNFVWRPIQIALYEIESTKKINTEQINRITDVIVKFFAERGVVLEFPSIESMINS